MPRLIFFGVSQKAIIDKMDGTVSMISLLSSINIQVPIDVEVPANLLSPLTWATVATWFRETDDLEKLFQAKIELLSPSGEVFFSQDNEPFTMLNPSYSTVSNSQGFPMGQQGTYIVRLLLREFDTGEWEEKSTAPIEVTYIRE